jgi:hypothetical protein
VRGGCGREIRQDVDPSTVGDADAVGVPAEVVADLWDGIKAAEAFGWAPEEGEDDAAYEDEASEGGGDRSGDRRLSSGNLPRRTEDAGDRSGGRGRRVGAGTHRSAVSKPRSDSDARGDGSAAFGHSPVDPGERSEVSGETAGAYGTRSGTLR